ncbi:MAG: phosphodiester glycosidase family protein, partial [Muribaculaceae bacterium]|nr:phosphodiester glycosidase family protein [Muribaculaceae bacterium]
MKQFGAQTVLQADGGGSAQMAISGSLVTKPADGSERKVASGIAVYSLSGGSTPSPEPEPENPGTENTLVEVTPASGTANPYAFEVTGEIDGNKLTVNYVLNAAASAVNVVLKKNGTAVKTVALASSYCTEAAHSAEIDLSDLAAGDYTWAVDVAGAAKDAVQEFKKIGFNHPQGVDTDRDFESPYFGRIYVTDGRKSSNSAHYSYANGGQGLYMFTPRFVGIQNWITGKYVYTGGVTIDQTVGTKSGADFRKVRIAQDGRVFVTRQNDSGSYLLEVPDATALQQNNANFTSVFTGGSLNTTTYAYENGSTFISAPNIGFDVKGGGDNLTIAMLSGQATLFTSSVVSA